MRLTKRILEAIVEMSARVEAGDVAHYRGYDRPEDEKAYLDAVNAGSWAREQLWKRERKRTKGK